MKKKLMWYVLEGPWEEDLDAALCRLKKWFIRPTLILATLYFGIGFVRAFVR